MFIVKPTYEAFYKGICYHEGDVIDAPLAEITPKEAVEPYKAQKNTTSEAPKVTENKEKG